MAELEDIEEYLATAEGNNAAPAIPKNNTALQQVEEEGEGGIYTLTVVYRHGFPLTI